MQETVHVDVNVNFAFIDTQSLLLHDASEELGTFPDAFAEPADF